VQGWGVNGLSLFSSLSLSTNQHRESQHIHLAVSLSTRRCLILLTKNKMTISLCSPLEIIYYSLHPAKTIRQFC
jgi:hypothetical protein